MALRKCSLLPANMTFHGIINNNTATLAPYPPRALSYPATPFNLTDQITSLTALGGAAYSFSNAFTSNGLVSYQGAVGWELDTQGSLADNYIVVHNDSWTSFISACNVTFRDPTADLMSQINEIMFRIAIAAGNDPGLNATEQLANRQIVQAIQTRTTTVYESHYAYLAATLAVMALSIAVVGATLHGWWHLGRDMTLRPIDIARCFDAPVFRHRNIREEKVLS